MEYPDADIAEVGKTKIFYLPDRELPFIDFTILVKAGAVDVPEERTGLSSLLEKCLIKET